MWSYWALLSMTEKYLFRSTSTYSLYIHWYLLIFGYFMILVTLFNGIFMKLIFGWQKLLYPLIENYLFKLLYDRKLSIFKLSTSHITVSGIWLIYVTFFVIWTTSYGRKYPIIILYSPIPPMFGFFFRFLQYFSRDLSLKFAIGFLLAFATGRCFRIVPLNCTTWYSIILNKFFNGFFNILHVPSTWWRVYRVRHARN